jgi:SAM-dependent methyltransferase
VVVYGGEERRSGLRESTKAFVRRSKDPFWNDVFVGDGLDVGSGNDPFKKEWFPAVKSVRTFDIADGDAQYLARAFRPGSFDFVHSSNCLEHLRCPWEAVLGWMHVLKPGGHMVFTVPDEDLYEQGVFPSRWNVDHKWTFTWHKDCSWTKRSINLDEMLVGMAKFCEVRRVFLADSGYDRAVTGVDQTVRGAEAFWEVVVRKLPVERKPRTFKHSGARGDLIYGLAAIRAMGGGTL